MKKVLEVTGEPILRGGQETFIINCICNIKNEDMHIDMLTLYYCENEYYRSIVENRGGECYIHSVHNQKKKALRVVFSGLFHLG